MARVSLAVIGTRVELASSASASMLFMLIGSSNQKGSNSSSAADPLGRGQIPERMELDHDVHAIADRLADLAEGLQRPVEIGVGDVAALAGRGISVEGPDLHAGDALLEQARSKLIGPVRKASRSS